MTIRLQKVLENRRAVFFHALAWLIFIFYEYTMLYFITLKWANLGDDLIFYGLHIGLFYLHSYVVLPYAFRRRPALLICFVLTAVEMSVYLLLKYAVDYYVESFRLPDDHVTKVIQYFWINGWRGLYFAGFSTVFWIVRRLFYFREAAAEARIREITSLRDKAAAEKDLAETRYAYLRQQIRPHFLFNTLNFMYNAIYKLSPAVSEYVLRLSDMMRYALTEPDANGTTALSDELEQIRHLISISRQRYDFPLYLDLEIKEVPPGLKLIPLVLLTLTENVFKHGNLKDKEWPAKITLSVNENNLLIFTTRNLEKNQTSAKKLKSIGLENTMKRLDYAYNGRYQLETRSEEGFFELVLKVQL